MRIQSRIAISFTSLLVVIGAGTIGYALIEHWSIPDSLYMVFITMSTVGFGEVGSLSPAGRFLTIGLIITAITIGGYALTNITSYIVSGQVVEGIRHRRMNRKIQTMKDHIILAGHGKLGREIAEELKRIDAKFCVLELDSSNAAEARDAGYLVIEGDASRDDVLQEAGVEKAYGLIAALTGDSANVMVTITARELNPKLHIVARGIDDHSRAKLRRAGADRVELPFKISGRRISSLMIRPGIVDFIDIYSRMFGDDIMLVQLEVPGDSAFSTKTLKEMDFRKATGGLAIMAIFHEDGTLVVHPDGDETIRDFDRLLVFGSLIQIEKFKSEFSVVESNNVGSGFTVRESSIQGGKQ
ncbi:MAG TPA: potassium channel protein [Bacteroidetes bacterium]|nr:voltage-gated potassium channel Kch [bacterium BMS3Bbin04]HDO64596.1 potassium channel protein [Bacteroidota bacterium]HEX03721.1 potassium channel protein [Bacteroidota bacterium]